MTVALVLGACSNSDTPPPGTGYCTAELSSLGRDCPATFDGTEANLPMCPAPTASAYRLESIDAWQCQELSVVGFRFTLSAFACYYDATSHALVGADGENDVPCDDEGNRVIKAGRTNSMCRENAPAFSLDCTP